MDWKRIRPWILPTVKPPAFEHLELPVGLRHYSLQRNGQYVRYHLRIERSGQSLLIVAASEAARLTKSGTIAALGVLEGKSDSQITNDLQQQANASKIISDVRELIGQLGLPNKRFPIFNLADPLAGDNPAGLIAPFQADVELPEGLDDLKARLRALWQAGIPHVRFVEAPSKQKSEKTHSDQPLSEERLKVLCGAVQFAEDMGMIAGVRLSASNFMQRTANGKPLVDRIAELGVDYVVAPWAVEPQLHQLIFGSTDQAQFQSLVERATHWEFPAVLEAGLVLESVNCFEEQLDLAIAQGITHFEVFPIVYPNETNNETNNESNEQSSPQAYQPRHLKQLAGWIEDLADNRRAQIVWLPPHTTASPLSQNRIRQLMKSGPRAGADVSIRVDASGQVFAPRGARTAVGKIQQSSWEQIWEHSCFQRFRELVCRNDHCNNCPMLTMCASHCPADQAGWTIEE